jgi:alanine-glyoxylate transaminase/serine-glyoxylate transaminase/serine-pyruvate transaminase
MAQGTHYLQIPGPSPVPERIQRAIDRQVIDHRSAVFQKLGQEVLEAIKEPFGTKGSVIIYPASGTGAWEAAIANTLSSGDKVLMVETGQFAVLWSQIAKRWGLQVELLETDWRHGVNPAEIEAKLAEDKSHTIKAVMVVHNETATSCASDIGAVRKAMDSARHPALLMIDSVSALASMPVKQDEWGVDVVVSGSQKGMMMPPGLAFTGISQKALAATKTGNLPRSYWDWNEMLKFNENGFFPYTPAINLLYGLKEALAMLREEGLDNVFARHERLAAATRAAVQAWGLELQCADPKAYSPVLTTVRMPNGFDADAFRKTTLEHFNISLGMGLGRVLGKAFRIGHLGDINELTLMAALSGVEMGLKVAGVPYKAGGVLAAMDVLTGESKKLRLSA